MSDINSKNSCISLLILFFLTTVKLWASFPFFIWLLVIFGQIYGLSRKDLGFVVPDTYTIFFKKKNGKKINIF